MKKTNLQVIEQCEYLKDILWYLRGQGFSKKHIKALKEAILYIQEKELR